MSIGSHTYPATDYDRGVVTFRAKFTGNGTSAPTGVAGRGASVSRSDVGVFLVTFPVTVTAAALLGLRVQLVGVNADNYQVVATINAGNVEVRIRDHDAALAAVDLTSNDTVFVSIDYLQS
jgi:dTDP-4-amino-4,6-dideoxygalactose transaminase